MNASAITDADIDVHCLPQSVQWIVSLIGFAATMDLVKQYGGGGVYIPKTADPTHRLAEVVGLVAFCKLVAEYAGEFLAVPRCLNMMLAARNRQIIAEYQSREYSQRQLAYRHKLTERTIWTIVHDVETRNGSLF